MNHFRCADTMPQTISSRRFGQRPGISTLEAIGALAAVSAGAWLGSMYLGVDLREAWNLAAGKAGFETIKVTIDEPEAETVGEPANSPDEGGPADQGVLQNETKEAEPADASAESEMQDEIERLRKTLERLESTQNSDRTPIQKQTVDTPKTGSTSSKNAVGKRTLAYWNKLNQIMLKEEQMRSVPTSGLTADNAGAFLAGRGKASRFAASTIRKLPTKNVDPVVSSLARDLAKWYEQGAKLNNQAKHLFNETDPATRRGPLGQSWSTAEKQHQNEVALLNRRGDVARRKMTAKYGLAFPDLR